MTFDDRTNNLFKRTPIVCRLVLVLRRAFRYANGLRLSVVVYAHCTVLGVHRYQPIELVSIN